MNKLSSPIASLCIDTFPTLKKKYADASANVLIANTGNLFISKCFFVSINNFNFKKDIINVIDPNRLDSFSPAESLSLIQKVSSDKKTLTDEQLERIANNIAADTSLDKVAILADKLPLDFFDKTSPETLANTVKSFDLNSMDESRKVFIAASVVSSLKPDAIKKLLETTSDPTIIGSIPSYLLENIDTTSIPASNLPDSFVNIFKHFFFII